MGMGIYVIYGKSGWNRVFKKEEKVVNITCQRSVKSSVLLGKSGDNHVLKKEEK